MMSSTGLRNPPLIDRTVELFPPEVGSVFDTSRCGRFGVVSSHFRPSTSFRFTFVSIKGDGGVFCKEAV